MHKRISTNFAALAMLVDAAFILITIQSTGGFIDSQVPTSWLQNLSIAVVWLVTLMVLSVYDQAIHSGLLRLSLAILAGNLLAGFSIAGLMVLSGHSLSIDHFWRFLLLVMLATAAWRLALAVFLFLSGEDHWNHPLLILGSDQVACDLLMDLRQVPSLGYQPIGLVALGNEDEVASEAVLGSLRDLREIIRANSVNHLVISKPAEKNIPIDSILSEVKGLKVNLWAFPDFLESAAHSARYERSQKLPIFQLASSTLTDRQRLVKRIFDLGVTCFLMPLSLVLMAAIAIAIRFEGRGSIFFRQKRVGENGEIFELYKFRTMIPHAEDYRHLVEHYDEHGNLIHKSERDPRVTRIGRFLRRTSLDELPQLFNVFQGKMSIVGPRPELPYLVEKYEPWQRKRFSVPPGLTCWWQVSGRSNRPMHLHTEDDLFYIDNYSFCFDLKIIAKTIVVVLRGKGAY